jgi:predicted peptidase
MRLYGSIAGFLLALAAPGAVRAVDDAALAAFTAAPGNDYRAIETPGRRNGERLPLIVFLHGDGQDGTDNVSQLEGYGNGSMELIDTALAGRIPLVYVAPQTTGAYWPPTRVAAVVADALKRFPIDRRRIVLTGLSSGATGVWDALKLKPDCYAAGVPMSGATNLAGLAPLVGVPLWLFHGEKDDDTDVETGDGGDLVGSRAIVRALRAMGAAPRYTEYPNERHVIWHRAYAEDALLPWMLDARSRRACAFP